MRLALAMLAAIAAAQPAVVSAQVAERARIFASEPTHHAVTVYRDPEREEGGRLERNWPKDFAMISETRTVTLPPGRSTVLFEGVAEGMVAVSAIVTGLPGGTIEKNRNADLLSPAALVDRSLGNRVTITRTNPATGVAASEEAIVRTRADGGLVLQTRDGFEAVRCSGLPEKLTFDDVPRELSADPIFNIDTYSETGGTYEVTLTYLSWGFDWEANYVAYLGDGNRDGTFDMQLMSWLTVLNDNGQSFPDAEMLVVAGKSAGGERSGRPRGCARSTPASSDLLSIGVFGDWIASASLRRPASAAASIASNDGRRTDHCDRDQIKARIQPIAQCPVRHFPRSDGNRRKSRRPQALSRSALGDRVRQRHEAGRLSQQRGGAFALALRGEVRFL